MKRPLLLLFLMTISSATYADALDRLSEQATFFESRSQTSNAIDAWERLLKARPQDSQALSRLTILHAREGNERQEKEYWNQLVRTVPAGSPILQQTQDELQLQRKLDKPALERARKLSEAGQAEESLRAYREAFGGEMPLSRSLGIEYFQIMSGIPAQLDKAIAGLGVLADRYPKDAEILRVQGELMTYRPAQRRAGIDQLLGVAEAGAKQPPQKALQQAFEWLDLRPSDASRLRRYEALYGVNGDFRKRIRPKTAGVPAPVVLTAEEQMLKDGFAALEDEQIDRARENFERLAQNRNDASNAAEATAGLALIALKLQDFQQAGALFKRVFAAKPSLKRKYGSAASAAAHWDAVERAKLAQKSGDAQQADLLYRESFANPPRGGVDPSTYVAYVDFLKSNGRVQESHVALESGLKDYPRDTELRLRGVERLLDEGEQEKAERLLGTISGLESSENVRALKARMAKMQARVALKDGDTAAARRYLEQGLAADPQDPWIRLELGRLLQQAGEKDKADSLLGSLVGASASSSQGWLAQAYVLGDRALWHETLLALERVAPQDRDAAAHALQKRAWISYQIQRVEHFVKRQDLPKAQKIMIDTVRVADGSAEFSPLLAQGWAALGDPARAVSTLRTALRSDDKERSSGARIQYAGLLLQLNQDAEFEAVSLDLIRQNELTPKDRQSLEDLIVGYRIKLTDRARESGAFDQAYGELRDVLDRYPKRTDVRFALARLMVDSGDRKRGVDLAEKILSETNPPSDEVILGAVDIALMAKDEAATEKWIRLAEERENLVPAALLARARLAEQRGQKSRALALFKEADTAASGGAAPAMPSLTYINPSAPTEVLVADSSDSIIGPLLPRATAGRAAGSGSGSGPEALDANRQAMSASTAGWFAGGVFSRSRVGEEGLSRLFELKLPLQWISRERPAGRFGIAITPVTLSSGRVEGENRVNRFGTSIVFGPEADGFNVSASGTAIQALYANGDLRLDVGTSPLGFDVENIIGGARWAPSGEKMRLVFDLSQRPVTDSTLSYAGIRDPRTNGLVWGGVVQSGGRIDAAYDLGSYGVYGNAGFHALSGKNVPDNSRLGLGIGMFFRLIDAPSEEVTVGLNVTTLSYDKNLRHFTFGHGGYFSPQFFGAITVPARFTGRYRDITYQLDAALGVQSFREDGNGLHPERPGLQAAAENEVAQRPNDVNYIAGYASQDDSGVAYSFGLSGRYRIAPQFDLSGRLSTDNAQDFTEYRIGVYGRWYFSAPADNPLLIDPQPLFEGMLP